MTLHNQVNDMDEESPESPHTVESLIWMNYLLQSPNPVLVEGGIFLATILGVDVQKKIEEIPLMNPASLDPLELLEAQLIAEHFEQHSHEWLCELAYWIPQWLQIDPQPSHPKEVM